jgi:amylosucrase
LQKLISVRKTIPSFADFNNRELVEVDNEHLFVFIRNNPDRDKEEVLVVANFDAKPQHLNLADLGNRSNFEYAQLRDLVTGDAPAIFKDELVIPPYHFYWLSDQYSTAIL